MKQHLGKYCFSVTAAVLLSALSLQGCAVPGLGVSESSSFTGRFESSDSSNEAEMKLNLFPAKKKAKTFAEINEIIQDAMNQGQASVEFYTEDYSLINLNRWITDFPGIQKLDCQYRPTMSGYNVVVSMDYWDAFPVTYAYQTGNTSSLSARQLELYNKVKSIADELRTGTGSGASGSTDQAYRLELAAHDYLVKNIAYNESSETDDGAYGALTSGQAVCNGYAESFMLLCNFLGIENTAISGYAGGEPHIWNEVKLGNDWYQVDVTWDDPVRSNFKSTDHTYFNISSADMDLDHSFETTQAPYREATGSAYTYLNQTFVESIASNSALTARLRALISSKASSFEFTTPAELDINSAANAVGMSYAFSYKMHTYTDSTYYQVNFTY